MRLDGMDRSSNVEDRRGRKAPLLAGGGGGIIVIIVILLLKVFNAPPAVQNMAGPLVQALENQAGQNAGTEAGPGIDDAARDFISKILRSTEEVWSQQFREHVEGGGYSEPKLVIFSGTDRSGCGVAQAEMGPFYCPTDRQIYIDPGFFDELARRHKAPGDFAQAYVIAHEVAHHVQNLTGMNQPVQQARQSGDEALENEMSVRLELQADYLAGVWAHHAQKNYNILDEGDIEEGINAANQIGDDTLQMEAQGYVVPERYTHGTSKQRAFWFRKGFTTGNFEACDELFRLPKNRL